MSRAERRITCEVNGRAVEVCVPVRLTLADLLREKVGTTGVHLGCEQGECGACTVLLDAEAVLSCLHLAVQADGRRVTTVEGLAEGGRLTPLQEAFRTCHAVQCGFCTPGMLLAAADLLRRHPDPQEADVRSALVGNLCRCTGYQSIVAAVLLAAGWMRGDVDVPDRPGRETAAGECGS